MGRRQCRLHEGASAEHHLHAVSLSTPDPEAAIAYLKQSREDSMQQ